MASREIPELSDELGTGDPGLAHERTELAWNRSGLAVLALVDIMMRRLWPLDGYRSIVALALIAFGSLTWAVGMFLARRSNPGAGTSYLLGTSTCRALTVGTLALAAAGFLLGALTPS